MSAQPVVSRFSYPYLQSIRAGRPNLLSLGHIPIAQAYEGETAVQDNSQVRLDPIIPTGLGSKVPYPFAGAANTPSGASGGAIVPKNTTSSGGGGLGSIVGGTGVNLSSKTILILGGGFLLLIFLYAFTLGRHHKGRRKSHKRRYRYVYG